MDISNLSKAQVLAALYNRAKPQGAGFLQYDSFPMTEDEAQKILDSGTTSFDYLKGRVMKINLSGNEVETWLYNRDNGENAAEMVIAELRQFGEVNSNLTQEAHQNMTMGAAKTAKAHLEDETTFEEGVVTLGLKGLAEHMEPVIDQILEKENK